MDKRNEARRILREVFTELEKEAMDMFGDDLSLIEEFDQLTMISDALEQVKPMGLN